MPQNQEIPRSSLPPAPPSTPQPTQRTVVRPSAIPNPETKPKALLSPIPDLDDEVPDMEMDEENDASRNLPRPPVVPINTALPPQPFRASAPTTPAASQAFQLFGNPTVSSVNTPTLSTQSASQVDAIAMNSTDTSYQQFIFPPDGQMALPLNYDLHSPGLQQDLGGLTIHDPANRLATASNPLQQLQLTINNSALSADPELNSPGPLSAGLAPSALGFGQEEKKYRCPVIGCEKAYKNQNGLKYHKAVSRSRFNAAFSNPNSMATAIKSSSKTRTAPSPLSTLSRQCRIQERSVWKRKSLIDARCAASDTRT
jgi:transcription factor SFP1